MMETVAATKAAPSFAQQVEEQYTVKEAAALLKVSQRTVWRLIADGSFSPKPWTVGGRVRLSASAINRFIERRRVRV